MAVRGVAASHHRLEHDGQDVAAIRASAAHQELECAAVLAAVVAFGTVGVQRRDARLGCVLAHAAASPPVISVDVIVHVSHLVLRV